MTSRRETRQASGNADENETKTMIVRRAPGDGGRVGSLRQALAAASADEGGDVAATGEPTGTVAGRELIPAARPDVGASDDIAAARMPPPVPRARDAAREARGGTPNIPPVDPDDRHVEFEPLPPAAVSEAPPDPAIEEDTNEMAPTQLVRGRQHVERGAFQQDPVVGWLVIVGGPGIGAFRPIFEGNNTVGRAETNRVPINFGDEAISGTEQAYIRYDSADRSFLFVPNLSKTNVVSVNDQRPAAPVPLQGMDVIVMGRTQLVFVPFCGTDFDWAELTEQKS